MKNTKNTITYFLLVPFAIFAFLLGVMAFSPASFAASSTPEAAQATAYSSSGEVRYTTTASSSGAVATQNNISTPQPQNLTATGSGFFLSFFFLLLITTAVITFKRRTQK
jgi:hypothetical protein